MHIAKIYGASYSEAELQRLRCMWTMGVPRGIIMDNLNRLTDEGIRRAARRRRYRRPDWFLNVRAQISKRPDLRPSVSREGAAARRKRKP